jgi:dihydroceramide fatty acyl 2-hydroxylase
MSVAPSKHFTPLYFYASVLPCLAFVATGQGLSSWSVILLLGSGFLSWGLIEYGLHRFIFHYDARSRVGRRLLYQAHLAHHENPKASTGNFASLCLTAPIAAAYWLVAWVATGSWPAASYLFIGMAVGYLYYQWLHFQCHHGTSRLRLLRYLRNYHLLHHYKTPGLRFGVTSPLFDLVFGTFRSVANRFS